MNKKLFFIFVIFTLIFIPFKVYGKEIIDIRKISDDQIVIAYDDNTIDVNGSIYENVKQFLSYYNRAYEGMYIDLDSNLYIERSGSKHLILENAIRILTNKNSYYTDSEFFIETQDNKIYKFNASTLKLELLEDSCKEVKFFDGETVYYTIDDTNDLYAVGKNTIGSKINNGEYLSERTLVLNNVKLIKDNLILTNNNELYIKSSDLPRPTFVMDGVIDFESKTNNLVYIVDSSNDVYRFYTYISDNVYVRRKEKINTSNIHKYDDSKTKTYSPGSDSFSYAVYAYVYTDEKVYCNDNLLLNDVIYFGEHYVLTSNGNLYIRSSSAFEESLNYSHLADVTYCEYQLVDRNVTQLMERQETSSYRTYLFYKKSDKSIWGLGAGNIFKLFDKSYSGYSYKMPFCVAGNCQPEVLLENVNINTVLVNQTVD